ncbi:hypothetical protein LAZ67_3002876 [Cordylochernes scorpioides]|uniref:DUF5641 domain-containing protein n=1 Tax=Cordylochernes scorpioides TaxID=51811 RepID=A0ABY6K939_9ARAC|nr:hypothetical protein LAZ67_3002876 [Cordylochernes scorpioides]
MSSHLDVMCTKLILDRGGSSKSPTVQDETLANLSTSPDVLLPTLRVTLKGNRTEKTARAIIDTGSQRSYILHSTAMEMEYEQSRREFFRHSLFGGSSTDVVEHEVYTIHLSDINNSYRCEFEALGQPLICGSIPPVCPRSFLEGSEELDVSDLMRDRIEVLIGADIAGRLLTDDQRRISSGLVAIRTKLGWTVMGKIPPTEVRDDISSLCVTTLLSLDLENLWKLDAIGVSDAEVEKKTQSLQAEMEEHFAHTTTRDIEGRYEVALPWVQDKERIPSNENLAENQLSKLKHLPNIEIPRWLCFKDSYVEKTTLHIFCDASQFAYATCIFLRIEKEDRVDIQLIQARTRVAPLKKLTIPRLELLACLIGARLAANVIQDLEFEEIPRFYWTDSTNAPCWIQREDNWAAFVMNRVKEIHNLSSPESWRHIPGRLNPADLPSRGCSAESLKETRWWEGPAWLKVSQEEWPKSTIIPDLEIVYSERRKTILNTLCTTRENENLFGRYSHFLRIVRITAWIYRFFNNAKINRRKIISEDLSTEEITKEVGVPDLDLIDNQTLSRKYQYIKRVREDLRERFRIEYFGFLRQETRCLKTTIPFKVGDMVLIGQESLKRLHWPLARIIQLYPGKDGLVRVAKVSPCTLCIITEVSALKKIAEKCEFPDLEDRLRDALVCGILNEEIQSMLLMNSMLTFKVAQEMALGHEAAVKNVAEIKDGKPQEEINVMGRAVKVRRRNEKIFKCFRLRTSGRDMNMLIDSGTRKNIISEKTYIETWVKSERPRIEKDYTKLVQWNRQRLSILGKIKADVKVNKRSITMEFLVIEGPGPNLIGREAFDQIGIGLEWISYGDSVCQINEVMNGNGMAAAMNGNGNGAKYGNGNGMAAAMNGNGNGMAAYMNGNGMAAMMNGNGGKYANGMMSGANGMGAGYMNGGEDMYSEGDGLSVYGNPGVDFPLFASVPETSFQCGQQELPGYYADQEGPTKAGGNTWAK